MNEQDAEFVKACKQQNIELSKFPTVGDEKFYLHRIELLIKVIEKQEKQIEHEKFCKEAFSNEMNRYAIALEKCKEQRNSSYKAHLTLTNEACMTNLEIQEADKELESILGQS